MDDVEIENQHEEEGENRGEDHVEVGPEFKSSYLKFANIFLHHHIILACRSTPKKGKLQQNSPNWPK